MAEQGNPKKPIARRAEDEGATMRLDQVRHAARPIGRAKHHERSQSQRDVHAVKLERALQASASDRLEAVLKRPGQVDEADRQTGQKDERLRAVREAEVPRSPIF